MKKIVFRPNNHPISKINIDPQPSISCLPEWYKNTPSNIDNEFRFVDGGINFTYKKCVPYLDAMSCGYLLFLSSDVYVDQSGNSEFTMQWKISDEVISTHYKDQIKYMKISNSYSKMPFVWNSGFTIETKNGYSCLFTHPLNRLDLPFVTLSGIVDTDKHKISINFPFFLKKDFNGIIPKGTPIVQIIPFKRENWKISIEKTLENIDSFKKEHMSYLQNAYRKLSWSRKSYR